MSCVLLTQLSLNIWNIQTLFLDQFSLSTENILCLLFCNFTVHSQWWLSPGHRSIWWPAVFVPWRARAASVRRGCWCRCGCWWHYAEGDVSTGRSPHCQSASLGQHDPPAYNHWIGVILVIFFLYRSLCLCEWVEFNTTLSIIPSTSEQETQFYNATEFLILITIKIRYLIPIDTSKLPRLFTQKLVCEYINLSMAYVSMHINKNYWT